MRLTRTGYLAIGNSNAREVLEVYKGNVVAKNFTRLVKTTASLSNLSITLNWESSLATNQYFIILDTHQQVANGTLVGEKSQRQLIQIFDAGNSTSPTIAFSQTATSFGNLIPYSSLSISPVYVNGTALTLQSSTNWATTGTLAHSFTIDVIQIPDVSQIGFVWLT